MDKQCKWQTGRAGGREKSGMVLVLVLLVVGVVAVLTLNAQLTTAGAMRHSAVRNKRMQLRVAATDAMLAFIRNPGVAGQGGTAWTPPPPAELPSGIKTAIVASDNTGLPESAIMLLGGRDEGSRLSLLESSATRDAMTECVRCVVRRKAASIEIIGWHQGI